LLLLSLLNGLDSFHEALLAMLFLRCLYFGSELLLGVDLPWTLYRILILKYIPWFALGISIYLMLHGRSARSRAPLITALCAVLTLFVTESVFMGLLAVALAGLVYAAASGRGGWLRWPPLIWLGTISYPLYLLHENIGWSVQLRVLELGLPIDVAVIAALATSLGLAALLTHWVEQPAMHWIRAHYRERRQKVVA
jgi:peptidoglycan/LPS O-acetylase OafA/YrhL